MTEQERDALVEAFQRPPYSQVGSWTFHYDDGDFLYDHPHQGVIYFTPDAEELGAVSIDLIDAGGNHQGSGRIPFTSMQAVDLFAIVRQFLTPPRAGRKEWDPRQPSLGAIDEPELAQEIYDFLDYHNVLTGEAYKFNIKLPSIEIPAEVREQISETAINEVSQAVMQESLEGYVDTFKQKFPWIRNWAQAGRMGGWLVLASHNPVLVIGHRPDGVAVPEVEPEDVKNARKRLRDLEKIEALIKEGKQWLMEDLASDDFWKDHVPTYQPRRGSRKYWDPREPQK